MATLTNYKGLDVVEGATGAGGQALTNNFKELADRAPFESTSNPTASSGSNQGFQKGSTWLNTTTQVLWICINDAPSAAVWKSVYKRTATALELIPQEAADTVQVAGNLQVAGKAQITGQVAMANGSNTNPALSFTEDLDTGIYRTTENEMRLSTGGILKMMIGSTGVSVGGAIPQGEFHVQSGDRGTTHTNVANFHCTKSTGNAFLNLSTASNIFSINMSTAASARWAITSTTGHFQLYNSGLGNIAFDIANPNNQARFYGGVRVASSAVALDYPSIGTGSANFPTYRPHAGQQNRGLYFPVDGVGISVGGADKIIAHSSGATVAGTLEVGKFTVATLPTAGVAGRTAFATNGRKQGESSGNGTGVPVYDDGTAWRTYSTDATVQA